MHIDRAAVPIILKAPDLVKQLIAGVNAVGIARQMKQQFQFLGRGVHHFAVHLKLIPGHVDGQLIVGDLLDVLGGGTRAGAAQNRLDPGDNFLGLKRLDHIIVRAQLQTEHLVKGLPLRRDHNNRGVGTLADFTADLPAVQLRHHDIQQHKVGGLGGKLFHRLLSVMRNDNGIPLFFQIQPD